MLNEKSVTTFPEKGAKEGCLENRIWSNVDYTQFKCFNHIITQTFDLISIIILIMLLQSEIFEWTISVANRTNCNHGSFHYLQQ